MPHKIRRGVRRSSGCLRSKAGKGIANMLQNTAKRKTQIWQIEEILNRKNRSGLPVSVEALEKRTEIDDAIRRRGRKQSAVDYVFHMLPERGFRLANGEADWVRFYKYARIEADVWSTFSSGAHRPSKETLLKIIVGLRLSEDEACELLSLEGNGFRSDDKRDNVLLACMECGYYEIEDVYEILEEYGGVVVNGKRLFQNIYRGSRAKENTPE